MTPAFIQILTQEFQKTLVGGRVSHISQSANETVELSFYHPDRPNRHLIVSILPQNPVLFTSTAKEPALAKPPNFCRSLRKNLEYAQLTSITADTGSRIIRFDLKTASGPHALVFEGIPKYPNLILLDPQDQIVSALRYKNDVERPVVPQALYTPPPQPAKWNLWTLDQAKLEQLWAAAGRPPLGIWLKNDFLGSDPELCAYLESFGDEAFVEWEKTRKDIEAGRFNHFLFLSGPPPQLKIFPTHITLPPQARTFNNASVAYEHWYRSENLNYQRQGDRQKLEHSIAKAIKHEKRIQEKLKKDRSEALKADQYQHWGELVMASLHLIKPHQTQVDLEDIVRGNPDPVTVPLDPSRSALINAQRFFKKSQKGSRGLEMVEKREKEVQQRIDDLKAAQRSLPSLQNVDEIKKAYQRLFPIAKAVDHKPKKLKEEKVPTPNITRIKVEKGYEICLGTSAAANEYVTFQLAQPEDLWFHVRDVPGSHVVLRRLQRTNPLRDDLIVKAAQEAANHSKAKPGTKVNVSYTFKKFVRKIPGAPMGMVTMTNEKSLLIGVEEKTKN